MPESIFYFSLIGVDSLNSWRTTISLISTDLALRPQLFVCLLRSMHDCLGGRSEGERAAHDTAFTVCSLLCSDSLYLAKDGFSLM